MRKKSSLPTVYLFFLGVGVVSGQEQPVPETTGQQEGSFSREIQSGEQGEQTPLSGTSEYSEGNENWRSNIFGRNWLDSNGTLGNALPIGQGRRFWAVENITRNGTLDLFGNSTNVISEPKTIADSLQNNSFIGNQLNGDYVKQGAILTGRTSSAANLSNVRINGYKGQTPDPDINANRWKISGRSIGDHAAGPGSRNRQSVAGQSIQSDVLIGYRASGTVTVTTGDVRVNIDLIDTEGTTSARVRKQGGNAFDTTLVSPTAISGLVKNVLRSSIFNKNLRRSIHYNKSIGDHTAGPVTFTYGAVNVDVNWDGHDVTSSAGFLGKPSTILGLDMNVPQSSRLGDSPGQSIQSDVSIGSHAAGTVSFTTGNVNINIDMTENEGTSRAGVLNHGGAAAETTLVSPIANSRLDNKSSQSSLLNGIPVQSIQGDVSIGDYAAGPVTVNLGTININIKMTGHEEFSRAGVLNHGGVVANTTLKSIPQSSLFHYLTDQSIHSGVSIGHQASGRVTFRHGTVVVNINRNGDRETFNSWNFNLDEGLAKAKLMPQSSLRDDIASQSIQSDVSIGHYASGTVTVTLGNININIKMRDDGKR